MSAIQRLVFCSLLLFSALSACSDPASGPESTGGNNEHGNSGFAFIAAIPDTLFVDEYAWVDVHAAGRDISALKLFIHTAQCPIDSITGDRIHFRIPENVSGGKARLYKYDTLEAKGIATINVYQTQEVSWPDSLFPSHGFVGSLLRLHCTNLPQHEREVSVKVDGVDFDLVAIKEDHFIFRVPKGARSGPIRIRTFNTVYDRGAFVLHEEGEKFLKEDALSSLSIMGSGLRINWDLGSTKGGDTTHRFEPGEYTAYTLSDRWDATIERKGDSIIISKTRDFEGNSETIDIRLKVEESTNRAWGTVKLYRNSLTEYKKYTYSFTFNGFRYFENDGAYEFAAVDEDVRECLTDLDYVYETPDGYADLTAFTGIKEKAFFHLILSQ